MPDTPTPRATPYCGPAPTPESLLTTWNTDPVLMVALALAAGGAAYRLRQGDMGGAGRRRGAGAAALTVAVVAFVSPLCALTVALFAARGLHHLVLVCALAPALALAFPWRWRRGEDGGGRGGAALVLLSLALWAWHVPAVYAAAWDHAEIYWMLQAALLLPAWLFWSGMLHISPPGDGGRAGGGGVLARDLAAAGQIAALAGQMGLIGAILTFAPRPLYPEHLVTTAGFGMDPLHDQQLAGLIMWVPGMLPLAAVAALVLRRAWRAEQAADMACRAGRRA